MERLFVCLIVILISDYVNCNGVTPSCVTVGVGGMATYNLTIDNNTPFKIKQNSKIVFNSPGSFNTNKYALTSLDDGRFQFVFKAVSREDGAPYSLVIGNGGEYNFQLIAIDQLIANVMPSDSLQLNQPISINCSLTYYGSGMSSNFDNPLTDQQAPSLSMFIGTSDNMKKMELPVYDNSFIFNHTKVIIYNITTSSENFDNEVICKVESKEPLFYLENRNIIRIIHPTDHVTVSDQSATTRQLGQKINCSANGYPFPTVRWVPVSVPQECVEGSVADNPRISTLTVKCAGQQTWNCTAVYANANNRMNIGAPYSFTVAGSTLNPGNGDTNKNTTDFWSSIPNPFYPMDLKTAAIAIAVGIFLLICLIISIICCCCCLRSYRKKATESKKALVKELSRQSSLTGIDLKGLTNNKDLAGAAITTAAAKSQPQVVEININTNGQPSQRFSLTDNGVKRISGGGGGDLGLGHLKGSGSVTTLDTSFEGGFGGRATPEPMKRKNKAAPKALVVQPRNTQKTVLVPQPRSKRSAGDSAC